eukprot:scaffold12559_cov125-Isochrysis_galbana.AAC.12
MPPIHPLPAPTHGFIQRLSFSTPLSAIFPACGTPVTVVRVLRERVCVHPCSPSLALCGSSN